MALTYAHEKISASVMLCDSVDAVGDKLYMLGGGWTTIGTPKLPFNQPRIGLGGTIRVPYTQTNQMHKLKLTLQDDDGKVIRFGPDPDNPGAPMAIEAQFNMGRPAVIQAGDGQNFPLALNLDRQHIASAGMYTFVLEIDEEATARVSFRVILLPAFRPA